MNFQEQMAIGKANRKRVVESVGSSTGDCFETTEARYRAKYDPDLEPSYSLEDTF